MPVLLALLLVVTVHLGTNLIAWSQVGLVADDRFAVGLPILFRMQGLSWLQQLDHVFFPTAEQNAGTALYRPFVGLLFTLEQPWFGIDARWYHAVNSLFHCTTALVWFGLVRRWSGSAFAGVAVALAFVGWPGHSEVTHWISARVNLQSLCFVSLALLVWDGAERRPRGAQRWPLVAVATVFALVAFGSKESAILLLPMAFLVSWMRSRGAGSASARGRRAILRLLPLVIALGAWAGLRRAVLHTWGAGTNSAWSLDVLSPAAWGNAIAGWGQQLMAPAHAHLAAGWCAPVLWALHAALLIAAATAFRNKELRPAIGFAALFCGIALLAVAGLHVDVVTLADLRHSYEPALALCLLLGLGVAGLPQQVRGLVLAGMVLVHAAVLDQNRENWLRAGALYSRMEREIQRAAATGPVRVFDAPAVYEGAFVYLVENSPMLLWPPFAPSVLQGRVTSASEWSSSLRELAALAAARQPLRDHFTVAWDDGELLPLQVDGTWPQRPSAGTTIDYARIGRQRPFAGSELPLQVFVQSAEPIELQAIATVGDRTFEGPVLHRGPAPAAVPVLVLLPLPADLRDREPVAVELCVRVEGQQRRLPLGTVTPVVRVRR